MVGVSRRNRAAANKTVNDTEGSRLTDGIEKSIELVSDTSIPAKRRLRGVDNDHEDETKRLRRSSGRVKNIPNYSVTPFKGHGGSTKQNTGAHDIISFTEKDSIPSIYALAQSPISDSKSKDKDSIKMRSAKLINHHDSLIQELYHLKNFTSLVYFNPKDIHRSSHYNDFAQKYDLWQGSSSTDQKGSGSSRRTSRRGAITSSSPGLMSEDKLRDEITKLAHSLLNDTTETQEELKKEKVKVVEEAKKGKKAAKSRWHKGEEEHEEDEPLKTEITVKAPETPVKKERGPYKTKNDRTESPKKTQISTPEKPGKSKVRSHTKTKVQEEEKVKGKDKNKGKNTLIETKSKGKGQAKSSIKVKGKAKQKLKVEDDDDNEEEEASKKEEAEEEEEEEEEEESEIDEMEALSDYEYDTDEEYPYPLPKSLKLIANPPKQFINHPSQITKPKFADLNEYLTSFITPIEESNPNYRDMSFDEYEDYLQSEYNLLNKIQKGLDNKVLRLDFNENVFRNVPAGVKEPTIVKKNVLLHQQYSKLPVEPFRSIGGGNTFTHHDHLLAQGMFSSKLIHDSRNNRIQKCRRIAQMIDVHFKRLSQESERKAKEEHRKRIRLARETAKEVKKRWLLAVKAYKILEDKEKEKERIAKSKEQLSKILDHSTKVLGAQLGSRKSETPGTGTQTETAMSASEEESDSDDDSNFSESDSDDHSLSTSEDESEVEDRKIKSKESSNADTVDDDSKLTVEQLKEKYKKLSEIELEAKAQSDSEDDEDSNSGSDSDSVIDSDDSDLSSSADDEESEEESEEEIGSGGGLAALYGGNSSEPVQGEKLSIVDQMTEEERQKLFADNAREHDSVLDSESDSDSDSKSKSSSKSKKSKKKTAGGLASLMSYNEDEDDSDDDSVYSEQEEKDTPNSSPETKALEDENGDNIVDVPVPSLLRGTLREYQKQGLNWLASLYNNGTNGILADEMGLGKTIQTISLISYLACEKNVWGPHLIIVPTSVMLNWEMEFKRFAPGFKVLTYYGSPQQRKEKRKGWNTPDTFHVCITSYQLVVQDQQIFKRKKWKYMILDEAHNIKNFRSQRWKALLNFNTENRLLLTGTPLQNNIMELWSLLYFLMPSSRANNEQTMPDGFANLMDFQQWFGRPVDKIIQAGGGLDGFQNDDETKKTVAKLHQVLRPYLLRRMKADVEKQMPAKYEHIVYCRLSKRQRLLYDDFMSRAQTKETLASGNFLSIINCLMQLRKVCNHPDLFEVRQISTSLAVEKSVASDFQLRELVVRKNLGIDQSFKETVDLNFLNLVMTSNNDLNSFNLQSIAKLSAVKEFQKQVDEFSKIDPVKPDYTNLEKYYEFLKYRELMKTKEIFKQRSYVNQMTCSRSPLLSSNLRELVTVRYQSQENRAQLEDLGLVHSIDSRSREMYDTVEKYSFVTPKVVVQDLSENLFVPESRQTLLDSGYSNDPFHHSQVKLSIAFPDKSLLQYDCGKLQKLAVLLQDLTSKGHRALIFTQMTKVLDILEQFLNIHGYRYMRLDGATKIEDRQLLTERFNKDTRISAFILSTRSGGLGINLTGADTVIFYDSDWNPAMDKQCQDRCHRIGQTRDVHIYRFVSEYTIESNILRKANQKRQLDNVVIQEGDFTTDYFGKLSVQDLLGQETTGDDESSGNNRLLLSGDTSGQNLNAALAQAEDEDDRAAASVAMKEVEVDDDDFDDAGGSSNKGTPGPGDSNGANTNTATPNGKERSKSVVSDMDVDVDEKVDLDADANAEMEKELQLQADKSKNGKYEYYEDEDDEGVGHIDEYMLRFIAEGWYQL